MNTPTFKYYLAFVLSLVSYFALSQDSENQIWVTFESTEDVPVSIEGKLTSRNTTIQSLIEFYSISEVEQVVPSSTNESLQRLYKVSCDCNTASLLEQIENHSSTLKDPVEAPVFISLSDPDDYNLSFQTDYALDLINAKDAWNYSMGDQSTIIGISDENYHITHEDLEGKIEFNEPINFSTNFYHGTAVALTAAGDTDNGLGKSAIGYDCKLSLTTMSYSRLLQMSQDGVRVINLSWTSGCSPNGYVQTIVNEIYNNGTVLVASAGNGMTCGGPTNMVFPAACDNVISVTSVGPNDNHEKIPGDQSSTHQHNPKVDICAPGYDVAISIAPQSYMYGNGTSLAAPMVSGTIGLMLSLRPCLTNEEIIEILRISSVDISAMNPSYVGLLGWGRLNAGKALQLTQENNCSGYWDTNTPTDTLVFSDTTVVVGSGNGNGGTGTEPLTSYNHKPLDDKWNLSSVSGLTENSGVTEFNVYPNPTSGSATLQWDFNERMELTVLDARGVIVEYQDLSSDMDQTEIHLLESGVYFLRIIRDGKPEWRGKLIRL